MHTKRNGVGITQGFCECIDHNNHPCKIIRDVLDLTKEKIEDWKVNGEWSWAPKLKRGENKGSMMKKNYEYEKEEIDSCQKIRGLIIEDQQQGAPDEKENENEMVGIVGVEAMEMESEVPEVPEQGMGVPEYGTEVPINGTEVPQLGTDINISSEDKPELWTRLIPPTRSQMWRN